MKNAMTFVDFLTGHRSMKVVTNSSEMMGFHITKR